jgi:hypothetical protein
MHSDREQTAPGKLWSLWDIMIDMQMGRIAAAFKEINGLDQFLANAGDSDFPLEENHVDSLIEAVRILRDEGQRVGLKFSPENAEELLPVLTNAPRSGGKVHFPYPGLFVLRNMVDRLADNFTRGLRDIKVLVLRPDKIHFYTDAATPYNRLAEVVSANLTEARICLALERNSACVYHLMLAMEHAVHTFAQKLKVENAKKNKHDMLKEKPWGAIIGELRPKINFMKQSTKGEKRKYEQYTRTLTYLDSVGESWRNPTMHPRPKAYNALEAQDILNQVEAFLRSLDETLSLR